MNVQYWRRFEDANLPRLGLAAAIGNRETARLRLGGYGEPAVPSPPTPEAE